MEALPTGTLYEAFPKGVLTTGLISSKYRIESPDHFLRLINKI